MQCHVEMTETMIDSWCQHWAQEGVPASVSVQTPQQMRVSVSDRITAMRNIADRLYGRWISGLQPD
jgi:hypothetical protein